MQASAGVDNVPCSASMGTASWQQTICLPGTLWFVTAEICQRVQLARSQAGVVWLGGKPMPRHNLPST
eukprot:6767257-Lingulodinium_polyedra.AAC.1